MPITNDKNIAVFATEVAALREAEFEIEKQAARGAKAIAERESTFTVSAMDEERALQNAKITGLSSANVINKVVVAVHAATEELEVELTDIGDGVMVPTGRYLDAADGTTVIIDPATV